VNISKTVADTAKLLLMTNMKSHMVFRLAPRSMTLDDLEVRIFSEFLWISRISDATAVKRMKIGQYCQRQRCRHIELEQLWQAFASRGFVSDSWASLFYICFIVFVCTSRSTHWFVLFRCRDNLI